MENFDWSIVGTVMIGMFIPLSIYLHRNWKIEQKERHHESLKWRKKIQKKQNKIYSEVKETNGRVKTLESWSKIHEKHDADRFKSLHDDILSVKQTRR